MIKRLILGLFLSIGLLSADEIKVAAAADLVYAFGEIKKVYEKLYPEDKLNIAFGSSGKAFTQISNGAPYEIFFSADMGYVEKLKEKGLAVGEVKPYAHGRIGFWAPKSEKLPLEKGMEILKDERVKKLAIADPEHAPYGIAAVNALKSQGMYELVKSKLVLGENVSQAAQFVQSGAANLGILPISLAYSDKLRNSGDFYLFPEEWHNEIIQGYGILKPGENKPSVKRFAEFVSTKEAREIFKKYGFLLPNE